MRPARLARMVAERGAVGDAEFRAAVFRAAGHGYLTSAIRPALWRPPCATR